MSGLLLTELTTVGERTGVGLLKPIIVFFGAVAVGLHLALFLIPADYTNIFLYVRNQFLAWSFLFSMVQILDFLKFHHMFGPWAIIISSLLVDLGKFMTVLFLFLIGFSMLVTAMNTPFYQLDLEVRTTELFLLYPLIQDGIGEEVAVPINCPTYPTATETTGWSNTTRGCRDSSDENIAMI